jgi:hypothetical protein
MYLEPKMRIIVTIEDSLYQQALDLADPSMTKSDLFNEVIKVFVRVRAAKRLIALGAAMPRISDNPNRD